MLDGAKPAQPNAQLGVICDMKRRRRRLEGLYSGFFAKKRVSRVIVAIESWAEWRHSIPGCCVPPGSADERQKSAAIGPAAKAVCFDAFSGPRTATPDQAQGRLSLKSACHQLCGPETDTGAAHRRQNRRRQHGPAGGCRIVRNPNSIAAIAPEPDHARERHPRHDQRPSAGRRPAISETTRR